MEEAIAMSLPQAASRSLSDLSTASQVERIHPKASPPSLLHPGSADSRRPSFEAPGGRPALVSLASPPVEPRPLPPNRQPTRIQRADGLARIAALPQLFQPTGHAWANSPLAKAKAPPPAMPLPLIHPFPDVERWYFFPTVARDPLIRRMAPVPRGAASHGESSDSSETESYHDASSSHSTAPTLDWADWD